jgi:ABC-2 type transport system ATP-binding protein
MSVIVEGISKYYGTHKALDSVSFTVSPGEIAGFIGPNGAGKSTMMKIICSLVEPDGGRVSINGTDVLSGTLEIKGTGLSAGKQSIVTPNVC